MTYVSRETYDPGLKFDRLEALGPLGSTPSTSTPDHAYGQLRGPGIHCTIPTLGVRYWPVQGGCHGDYHHTHDHPEARDQLHTG